MKPFHRAALLIFLVLAVHAVAVSSDWYRDSLFDVPMHWAGGFAMAFLGYAVLAAWGKLPQSTTLLVRMGWVIGFVAVIGIGWEWFEFLCDQILPRVISGYIPAQPSIGDTMVDLFLDLFGGAVGYALARWYDR